MVGGKQGGSEAPEGRGSKLSVLQRTVASSVKDYTPSSAHHRGPSAEGSESPTGSYPRHSVPHGSFSYVECWIRHSRLGWDGEKWGLIRRAVVRVAGLFTILHGSRCGDQRLLGAWAMPTANNKRHSTPNLVPGHFAAPFGECTLNCVHARRKSRTSQSGTRKNP